jgi:hypothetical protein
MIKNYRKLGLPYPPLTNIDCLSKPSLQFSHLHQPVQLLFEVTIRGNVLLNSKHVIQLLWSTLIILDDKYLNSKHMTSQSRVSTKYDKIRKWETHFSHCGQH